MKNISTNENDFIYWYAMSVPYNRVIKIKEILDKKQIECFVPMRYEIRTVKGRKTRLYIPAVSNLIFVHATATSLKHFKQAHTSLQYLVRNVNGTSQKIIVPDKQMEQFIQICQTNDEQLQYLRPDEINFSKGTRVRIHGGTFDGIEGTFVKIKGHRNRRIVVQINDVFAIAISEISPDLIEVLN